MTSEQVEKFLKSKKITINLVKIDFKTRNSVMGVFLKTPDYNDLKSKNFWRIVTGVNLEN